MTQGNIPAGWYDDGQGAQRWWDGAQWTEHTQPGPAPAPPAAPESPETPQAPTGPSSDPVVDLDKGAGSASAAPSAPEAPAGPSHDVTRIAPAGRNPLGQPGQPSYGQPGQPGQPSYGQPGQPPYGQGGQGGQGGYAAPGQPAWQSQFPTGPNGSSGGKGKLFAIIGGAAALLLVVVVLLVVVLGGGGGPSDTVEEFYDSATDNDCDALDVFSNELLETDEDGRDGALDEAKKECEDAENPFVEDGASDGCDLEITDEEVDGKKATVDYEFKGCEDESQNEGGTFELVEEDGDWRIDTLG